MRQFDDYDEIEAQLCEVCGSVSETLISCDLCEKNCCPTCLDSQNLCRACQAIPEY